ncbi:MAG TPA: FecR domain-containing protein [Flavobacterium sp.]|jgi:ferric-dicitrate binding protein FerR (iron transport regulator)
MEQQHDLAKWLAGEMSDSELQQFKTSPEYETYQKIATYTTQFAMPDFDEKQQYQQLLVRNDPKKRFRPLYSTLLKVAAILVIAAGIFTFVKPLSTKTELADNGTKNAFTLPDKSIVTLNSGSRLSYPNWDWSNNRAVQLEGEAYFEVARGKRFDVNTAVGKVSVLGTKFNVRNRASRFEVACFEGRVRVVYAGKTLILTKGEAFAAAEGKIIPVIGQAGDAPLWLKDQIRFYSASLDEIIFEMERQYAIDIVTGTSLSDKRFTGIVPAKNLDTAIQMICRLYNLKASQDKNQIRLSPNV